MYARRNRVYAGAAVLVVGVVVVGIGLAGYAEASANFMNCTAGFPMPEPTFPTACLDALNALGAYEMLSGFGGLVSLVGFVLLLVGLVLQPARPVPTALPGYPPSERTPPASPQGGPTPPPPPLPCTERGGICASNTN